MIYILWVALIVIISFISFALILTCDENNGLRFNGSILAASAVFILASAGVAGSVRDIGREILLCFFFAYLVTASYCDYCTQLVYQFLYIPAFTAGIGYTILARPPLESLFSIGIFYMLNILLFKRYFGRADSVAFMISVLFFTHNQGMVSMLLWGLFHMLLALGLVFVVKHKKIDFKRGCIEPTAFMPYISVAALVLFYISIKV